MTIQTSTQFKGSEKRLFTVDEYYRMAEFGLFENQRVELIHGEIIVMSPMNDPHLGMVARIMRLLNMHSVDKYFYSPQSPLRLETQNVPEPDIVVAKPREDDYMNSPMKPEDVHLVIEVSDSTIQRDRKVKIPLYAMADIPEYWIVNLKEHQVEIFREPENETYQKTIIAKSGEIAVCEKTRFTVSVDDLFKGLNKD